MQRCGFWTIVSEKGHECEEKGNPERHYYCSQHLPAMSSLILVGVFIALAYITCVAYRAARSCFPTETDSAAAQYVQRMRVHCSERGCILLIHTSVAHVLTTGRGLANQLTASRFLCAFLVLL